VLSVSPASRSTAWISAQRPPRTVQLDQFKPHGFFLEHERTASGQVVESAVILLTNKECPWRCLMCDLWMNTTTHSVPAGAIPAQIAHALKELSAPRIDQSTEKHCPSALAQLKLYNSGSFFDSAAIPLEDYPAIAEKVSFAKNVIVESHPRLVGERALRLQGLLAGSLEVAMGLETIHPEILPRLNKKFTLDHFVQAAQFLRRAGIAMRAFVLVKTPFMDEDEGVDWAVRSAEFAFKCGATAVSMIPTRPGNGAMERLMEAGEFVPPRLSSLERALKRGLALRAGCVFADTWDLQKFTSCARCFDARMKRLEEMNLSQRIIPPLACPACAGE
jgi:radical SAM enzyme (TIGR01210 family)